MQIETYLFKCNEKIFSSEELKNHINLFCQKDNSEWQLHSSNSNSGNSLFCEGSNEDIEECFTWLNHSMELHLYEEEKIKEIWIKS